MGGGAAETFRQNCEPWIILENQVTYSRLGVWEGFLEEVTLKVISLR